MVASKFESVSFAQTAIVHYRFCIAAFQRHLDPFFENGESFYDISGSWEKFDLSSLLVPMTSPACEEAETAMTSVIPLYAELAQDWWTKLLLSLFDVADRSLYGLLTDVSATLPSPEPGHVRQSVQRSMSNKKQRQQQLCPPISCQLKSSVFIFELISIEEAI
ncbi:hypothetical protein KIN20_035391 [Parelaphostrongylus tenuis]|uniref:Uncharacterized protein n=1 Tax=Parelaphostrongylus tenuis TaxID=148309 RepID=A0AAD5RBQ0_PARTN|nr:hypothetical protein KIN20_035391 [Parelaphostrongylus tenuis]